jgi:predicted SAM-dependent methyltransferase
VTAGSAPATSGAPSNLQIGGKVRKEGWINLNIQPGPSVDHVGDCVSLSQFPDAAFQQIYASHVLEHLGYQKELSAALAEMFRVLRPGGNLMVSVPDLERLCQLFVHPDLDNQNRFQVMRVMFGGQMDTHDVHKVGLSWAFLRNYLEQAGFQAMKRVKTFGLFQDNSEYEMFGHRISLNVDAQKPA